MVSLAENAWFKIIIKIHKQELRTKQKHNKCTAKMCLIGKEVKVPDNKWVKFNTTHRQKVAGKNAGSVLELNLSCAIY